MNLKLLDLIFLNFLMMLIFSLNFIIMEKINFFEFEIYSLNSTSVEFTISLNSMTLLFMKFVFLISSMVILYSEVYMEGELNMNRFTWLVVLFVFSMMFLILSPNLISIMLGWDGLGLVSYCLVIFHQNIKSFNAGMLTILSNRVGDAMLLIANAWMMNYRSWNLIFYMDFFNEDYYMSMIAFFVIIAAMTKSAQMPFLLGYLQL